MLYSIAAISIGASAGAVLRWVLGLLLNTFFVIFPLGTLVANLLGGYLIGIAIAFFFNNSQVSQEWKLFVITGFLGGLTTFSSFSAEAVSLFQQEKILWACLLILVHVVGSLVLTLLGIATYSFLKN